MLINADVAELADALVLGTSVNDVGVQVPSSAPTIKFEPIRGSFFYFKLHINLETRNIILQQQILYGWRKKWQEKKML